jgi:hypothetical protein
VESEYVPFITVMAKKQSAFGANPKIGSYDVDPASNDVIRPIVAHLQ